MGALKLKMNVAYPPTNKEAPGEGGLGSQEVPIPSGNIAIGLAIRKSPRKGTSLSLVYGVS